MMLDARSRRSEATVARRYCAQCMHVTRILRRRLSVRFGRRAGKRGYGMCFLHAPDRAVEASGSEAKTLSDVLEE